jgi:hypothetical protein
MVTMEEYREIKEDRPVKFDAKEVGFRKAKEGEPMCAGCVHWFRGLAHDVCEIQRPKDEQVPWDWTCKFQTSDWVHFPLYDGKYNEQKKEQKETPR